MRKNNKENRSSIIPNAAHLIEQLRLDTVPHSFSDVDKRELSESIHKIVADALRKK